LPNDIKTGILIVSRDGVWLTRVSSWRD